MSFGDTQRLRCFVLLRASIACKDRHKQVLNRATVLETRPSSSAQHRCDVICTHQTGEFFQSQQILPTVVTTDAQRVQEGVDGRYS